MTVQEKCLKIVDEVIENRKTGTVSTVPVLL